MPISDVSDDTTQNTKTESGLPVSVEFCSFVTQTVDLFITVIALEANYSILLAEGQLYIALTASSVS